MILHIIPHADWRRAQAEGLYRAGSLESEGFIHCSTPAQVLAAAGAHFRNVGGLALLVIDPTRVAAPIVYEDSYGSGQEYPHIYGPLNLDAVEHVLDFPVRPDGGFDLPAELAGGNTSV
ncbi:MAG TPA: DUF952 domain-containing protein [Roseiflexaceae bacterium]|nr:DUF952 domain-containing protein [Roseiflexaceae bacterium]